MAFMKKNPSCLERKGGTYSQAGEVFLAFWTGKKSNCLNHLLQRAVTKAFADPDLQCSQTGSGKVISHTASAEDG